MTQGKHTVDSMTALHRWFPQHRRAARHLRETAARATGTLIRLTAEVVDVRETVGREAKIPALVR